MSISTSVFSSNQAEAGAAALWTHWDSVLELHNCTFWRNSGESCIEMFSQYEFMTNCIIAETQGRAGSFGGAWTCCDFYASTDPQDDDCYSSSCFCADPLFCDPEHGDFGLREDSPCAPGNSGTCELIGAKGVNCSAMPVRETTWGRLKAMYRSGQP